MAPDGSASWVISSESAPPPAATSAAVTASAGTSTANAPSLPVKCAACPGMSGMAPWSMETGCGRPMAVVGSTIGVAGAGDVTGPGRGDGMAGSSLAGVGTGVGVGAGVPTVAPCAALAADDPSAAPACAVTSTGASCASTPASNTTTSSPARTVVHRRRVPWPMLIPPARRVHRASRRPTVILTPHYSRPSRPRSGEPLSCHIPRDCAS
jgi:hypothetical protein